MKEKHKHRNMAPERSGQNGRPEGRNRTLLRIGWIFLFVMLILAVCAVVWLLRPREEPELVAPGERPAAAENVRSPAQSVHPAEAIRTAAAAVIIFPQTIRFLLPCIRSVRIVHSDIIPHFHAFP